MPANRRTSAHQIDCGGETFVVTSYPPLATEWGRSWWAYLDGDWVRLRTRGLDEPLTAAVAQDLCERIGLARRRAGDTLQGK